MKKPIFDQLDRWIITEDNSLSASRMKLFIAFKKVEKEFIKSFNKFLFKIGLIKL